MLESMHGESTTRKKSMADIAQQLSQREEASRVAQAEMQEVLSLQAEAASELVSDAVNALGSEIRGTVEALAAGLEEKNAALEARVRNQMAETLVQVRHGVARCGTVWHGAACSTAVVRIVAVIATIQIRADS